MIAEVPLLDDGVPSMAVRAEYFAQGDFLFEQGERTLTSGKLHDARSLRARVVKIQDDRV
jgi:hypothetical protein